MMNLCPRVKVKPFCIYVHLFASLYISLHLSASLYISLHLSTTSKAHQRSYKSSYFNRHVTTSMCPYLRPSMPIDIYSHRTAPTYATLRGATPIYTTPYPSTTICAHLRPFECFRMLLHVSPQSHADRHESTRNSAKQFKPRRT